MKKSLIGLIGICLFSVAGLAIIAACGGSKKLNHIYLKFADGSDNKAEVYVGEFDYGTPFSDIDPGYTVIAVADDGTEREMSEEEYSVTITYDNRLETGGNIDEIPAVPDAGYYEVKIEAENNNSSIYSFVVNPVDRQYTVTFEKRSWSYIDVPKVSISHIEEFGEQAQDINYYCIEIGAYNALTDEQKEDFKENYYDYGCNYISGSPLVLQPGTYYAFAEVPALCNYNSVVTDITLGSSFTVTKATLTRTDVEFDAQIMFEVFAPHKETVKLSELMICSSIKEMGDGGYSTNPVFYIDNEDGSITLTYGTLRWVDGDQEVSAADIGKRYAVEFVLDESQENYFSNVKITGYVTLN